MLKGFDLLGEHLRKCYNYHDIYEELGLESYRESNKKIKYKATKI